VIHTFFLNQGYTQCPKEPCIYTRLSQGEEFTIFTLFVDDILYTGNNEEEKLRMEKELVKTFNTKLMGILNYAFRVRFD
jgi:hypothetical protein